MLACFFLKLFLPSYDACLGALHSLTLVPEKQFHFVGVFSSPSMLRHALLQTSVIINKSYLGSSNL